MASSLDPSAKALIALAARFDWEREAQLTLLYEQHEKGPFNTSFPEDVEQVHIRHKEDESPDQTKQIVSTDLREGDPFPKLNDLHISNLRIERELFTSFLQAPNLTKLRVHNCGLRYPEVLLICSCLKTSQKIEELAVDRNLLIPEWTKEILENLPPNIRVVNIEGNYLNDSGMRYLANLITRSQIRSIEVSPHLSQVRTWPKAIAEALPNTPFLRDLSFIAMYPTYTLRGYHRLTLAEVRPMLEPLDNPSCLSLDIVSFSNSYARNHKDQILERDAADLVTEGENNEQHFRANSRILISELKHLDGETLPRYFIPEHKKDARHCEGLPFADVMRYLLAENKKFPIRRLFLERLTDWKSTGNQNRSLLLSEQLFLFDTSGSKARLASPLFVPAHPLGFCKDMSLHRRLYLLLRGAARQTEQSVERIEPKIVTMFPIRRARPLIGLNPTSSSAVQTRRLSPFFDRAKIGREVE